MELPERAVDLLETALSILENGGHPGMIVGGIATFAWGDPRTTRDLDIAVLAEREDMDAVGRILTDAGFETFPGERSRDLQDAVGILYKQSGKLDEAYLEKRAEEENLDHELERAQRATKDFEAGQA